VRASRREHDDLADARLDLVVEREVHLAEQLVHLAEELVAADALLQHRLAVHADRVAGRAG